MAGLLDPFLRGLGGQSDSESLLPGEGSLSGSHDMPKNRRAEKRQTPPLSVVRAEIDGADGTVYSGQLWDISRSGASISLGRNSFRMLKGTEIELRLRSRNSADVVTIPATVRWVDINHGATFLGVQFAHPLPSGTYLDAFVDLEGQIT